MNDVAWLLAGALVVVAVMGEEMKQAATEWLNETWRELRNGAGPARKSYFAGAVDVLKDLGLLNAEEQNGWIARAMTCPGHDDEGGRNWCAYCGEMRQEAV